MYKKTLVFTCCVVLFSKTLKSQVVSVEGVWHADTVKCAAPFSLGLFFMDLSVLSSNLFDRLFFEY